MGVQNPRGRTESTGHFLRGQRQPRTKECPVHSEGNWGVTSEACILSASIWTQERIGVYAFSPVKSWPSLSRFGWKAGFRHLLRADTRPGRRKGMHAIVTLQWRMGVSTYSRNRRLLGSGKARPDGWGGYRSLCAHHESTPYSTCGYGVLTYTLWGSGHKEEQCPTRTTAMIIRGQNACRESHDTKAELCPPPYVQTSCTMTRTHLRSLPLHF